MTHAEKAIAEHLFPGCVIGVIDALGKREVQAFGHFTYDHDSPKVTTKTIYDLASVTKVMPVSTLVLHLLSTGKLSLHDKAKTFLPELSFSHAEDITIKHLLTYTVVGYGFASLKLPSADAFFETLFTKELPSIPGKEYSYTNLPATILGLILERIYQKPLDQIARDTLFDPLGMNSTTFFPDRLQVKHLYPPTEITKKRGLVQGIVHDESAALCYVDGKIVGHAGLFSNADDILTFLYLYLNKGILHEDSFITNEVLAQIETNHIEPLGACTGLGWELGCSYFGSGHHPHRFGKTGFTGTMVVIDRKLGKALVILSNRTYPQRPSNRQPMDAFRKTICDELFHS